MIPLFPEFKMLEITDQETLSTIANLFLPILITIS